MKAKTIKPDMIIQCCTKEERKILHNALRHIGSLAQGYISWKQFNQPCCYYYISYNPRISVNFGIGCMIISNKFGSIDDNDVYKMSNLIEEDMALTNAEQIIYEICDANDHCSGCPFFTENENNGCSAFTPFSNRYQEAIKQICNQWNADHKKSEPERDLPEKRIKRLMAVRGFTESDRALDELGNVRINFIQDITADTPNVACVVYLDTLEFSFQYCVPASINRLVTPKCSAIEQDIHFYKIYAKFLKHVLMLSNNQ